jgi:hypothetical protein
VAVVGGGVGFLRFRCLFQGWPFSRLAGMEEEVFERCVAVLVELVEAKKWLEVGTGTGWPRGTLARVAGGGHLWWIRARAWKGRRALWRSCAVDLGEMDMERCREDGGGVVDWPPGRPEPWSDLPLFYPCFLALFSGAETGVFGVAVLELGEAAGLPIAGA